MSAMNTKTLLVAIGAAVALAGAGLAACGGGGSGTNDAGPGDAGTHDATVQDTGSTDSSNPTFGDVTLSTDVGTVAPIPATCQESQNRNSYIGCDYWPTVTLNPACFRRWIVHLRNL